MDVEATCMAGSEADQTYESRLLDVADRLQVPDSTLQITRVRLDRLAGESDVDEIQLERIAPAVLALSCREDGLPLTDADIVESWVSLLEDPGEVGLDPDRLPEQIEAVADRLGIDQPPARPDVLLGEYADALEVSDALETVAHRLLRDAYRAAPRIVAEASSPSETASAALVLAADVNEIEELGPSDVAAVGSAGGVTIKNRYKAFRDALGEEVLADERYRAAAVEVTDESRDTRSEPDETPVDDADGPDAVEADGEGASEAAPDVAADACLDVVHETFPDELPTTATVAEAVDAPEDAVAAQLESLAEDGDIEARRAGETVAWLPGDGEELGADLAVEAVQEEIDALVEELGVDASIRLFARGLVSDADGAVPVENAGEFAGAALIASSRVNDGDLDPATVAAERDFEPRALYEWLDRVDEIADVEIPQRSPVDVVESLVADLDLSDRVREESLQTLEHYSPEEDGAFAAPELAAGAVFFAATTIREPIDVDELADSTGFGTDSVSDAMNSVFVSLCRRLLRGEIAYEECSWTDELLESDHIAEIGDPHTGRVVAAAKTYIAGREGEHVDEGTLDVLLAED